MTDESYAEKLQLQEVIVSSLITPHFPVGDIFSPDKKNPGDEIGKSLYYFSTEVGESSTKYSMAKIEEIFTQQHMCEICAERKNDRDFFPVQRCSHKFCTQCVAKHISIKIHKGNITYQGGAGGEYLTCPGVDCGGVLGIDACRRILSGEVLDTWDELLCESTITPSQRFYCPYKSCSALLVNESGGVGGAAMIREAECPFCNRLFCAECKVPWHSGIDCEDLSRDEREREGDLMVHELAKKNKWQRCPRCRYFVEKNDGCLHMTCRCGFQFCYACGKTWTSSHGGCQ